MRRTVITLSLADPLVWACFHEMWRAAMGDIKAAVVPSHIPEGWGACRWVSGSGAVAVAWGHTREEALVRGMKWVFSR